MIELNDAQRRLAARLRELRASWPDVAVTQRDLARAFGGDKPLSVPLISSWETQANPKIPPPHRIESYAAFFATVRSMAVPERPRLLRDDELCAAIAGDAAGAYRAAYEKALGPAPAPRSPQSLQSRSPEEPA